MEESKGEVAGEASPPVSTVADEAYRAMIEEGEDQLIIHISIGENGKTINKIFNSLAYVLAEPPRDRGIFITKKIVQSNRILEAFGNAKTVLDENSSRFAKFVEIQFDENGRMSGGSIRTYLLERSRVCCVNSQQERNYHCFYYLYAAPYEVKKIFKLDDSQPFCSLKQFECSKLDDADIGKYQETREAMKEIGITEEEQEAIFRILAAILHLGNINFADGVEAYSSKLEDAKSIYHLETTAQLLRCNAADLENALTHRDTMIHQEVIRRNIGPKVAAICRDTLAKIIYSRLFDWLVERINSSIGQIPNYKSRIAVVDTFGFENLENNNSFEQFCINYSHEKLHYYMNKNMLGRKQKENTKDIDLIYAIDLIEKKPGGIIATLDESCINPASTHKTFSDKVYRTLANDKWFTKPLQKQYDKTLLTICQNAGEVAYRIDNFLDKNKEYDHPDHQKLLSASKCSFVASLFRNPPSVSWAFSSVGSRFKRELQELMSDLDIAQPHCIFCVEPNNDCIPGLFKRSNVRHLPPYSGVYEATRSSSDVYPIQRMFHEFLQRFTLLAPGVLNEMYDEKAACKIILDKIGLKDYQLDETKVLLRAGQMAVLNARRTEIQVRAARPILAFVNTLAARRKFLQLRQSSILVQSYWRGRQARKLYKEMTASLGDTRGIKETEKDTVILKTANDELQKLVDDLTQQLQLEKKSKTDLAETRAKENVLLQEKLHDMQLQLERAKAMINAEREAASKAIEDKDKIDTLTFEIECLKTEMTEAKAKANAEIDGMKLHVHEANAMATKEREASQMTTGALTAEIEFLKQTEEAKTTFNEARRRKTESLETNGDVDPKVDQSKNDSERLERELTDLGADSQFAKNYIWISMVLVCMGAIFLYR